MLILLYWVLKKCVKFQVLGNREVLGFDRKGPRKSWKSPWISYPVNNGAGAAKDENPRGALLIEFTVLYENVYLQ